MKDVYEIVTEKILEALDKGVIPWRKPWNAPNACNLESGRPYTGMNEFLLGMADHKRPYYITFEGAKRLGGHINKGEKGSVAMFWKSLKVKDKETEEEKTIPYLRYYTVFNIDQTSGLDKQYEKLESELNIVKHTIGTSAECDAVLDHYTDKPEMKHGGTRAFYQPADDRIQLPEKELFTSYQEYYSTLYHEMAHSTGHKARLNRLTDLAAFGSDEYSKEELVAEMAACMLCSVAGIGSDTLSNSASYIDNWKRVIRADKKILISASSKAKKACEYILKKEAAV